MKVAVLGTGIMGAGMARSLVREGHTVRAWNRTAEKAAPLADDGVTVSGSVAEAVADADVVVTMLFDADATLEVGREALGAAGPGAVWLQCGTVGVDGARRVAEVGGDRVLDAPVLGTRKPAEEGALVVLLSGPETLRATVAPVLEAIGSRTLVAGDAVGAASALKLACNAWVALLTAGTAQSLALAETLGVDPRLFLEAIDGGPVFAPYAKVKGGAMLESDWTPSFEVDGVVKDVGLMLDAARGAAFPTPLLDAVHGLFAEASAAGHGADDMAAVRTAFPAGGAAADQPLRRYRYLVEVGDVATTADAHAEALAQRPAEDRRAVLDLVRSELLVGMHVAEDDAHALARYLVTAERRRSGVFAALVPRRVLTALVAALEDTASPEVLESYDRWQPREVLAAGEGAAGAAPPVGAWDRLEDDPVYHFMVENQQASPSERPAVRG